jgi:hypothetical protein
VSSSSLDPPPNSVFLCPRRFEAYSDKYFFYEVVVTARRLILVSLSYGLTEDRQTSLAWQAFARVLFLVVHTSTG